MNIEDYAINFTTHELLYNSEQDKWICAHCKSEFDSQKATADCPGYELYHHNSIPEELNSLFHLKIRGLKPKQNANPRGASYNWSGRYCNPLYYIGDCEEDEERLITKTELKQNFQLSDKWIKKLGEADEYENNPKFSKAYPMQLYQLQRVKDFIAGNQEEYDKWIQKRAKLVESQKNANRVYYTKYEKFLMENRKFSSSWAKDLLQKSDWVILNIESTNLDATRQFKIAIIDYTQKVLLNKPCKAFIKGKDKAYKKSLLFPEIYQLIKNVITGKKVLMYNSEFHINFLDFG